MYAKAFKDLQTTFSLWHVWFYQAYHVISAKYKRTALGSLWIAGSMIFTSISLSIVFGGIFGQNLKETLPYIMSGLICFTLAGYPIIEGQDTFVNNSGTIKNHAYPFNFYIFEAVSKTLMLFLHNILVYYIAMVFVSAIKLPHWTIFPALMLVTVNMIVWSTITSLLTARYRDLRFLLPYIGQVMSFVTPVFWHSEQLTGWRRLIVNLNPLHGLLEIIRSPLLGQAPKYNQWILASISLVIGIMIWSFVFPYFRRRIAFWV